MEPARPSRAGGTLHPPRWRDGAWIVFWLAVLAFSAYFAHYRTVSGPETTVFRWLNDAPSAVYVAMYWIMQLGNFFAVPVSAAVAAATLRFRLAAGLLLGGFGTYFLAKVVKRDVHRGRPAELLPDVHILGAAARGLGYISGHTATVVVLATVAWPYLGRWLRAVLAVLVVLACLARVYVGSHLPLDIVGGAALGFAVGMAVRVLIAATLRWQRSVRPA